MRPRKDSMTEYLLFGILLLPLLWLAAALAQVTEETSGLAALISGLSELMSEPLSLRWCASTGKFLVATLIIYPLAVICYLQDKADRHPGAEHGTAKWGNPNQLNRKYRDRKNKNNNFILSMNIRFSLNSHLPRLNM